MTRSRMQAVLVVVVALAAHAGWRPLDAATVEVVSWGDSLIPPPFAGSDDVRAAVAYLPDTLRADERPELPTTYVGAPPTIDADLDDWPVVRWREARGTGAVVRGRWSGSGDASLRFALLWSTSGLVLGAEVHDDSLLQSSPSPPERVESALLYIGTASPSVTRYWRGGERAFRVWADGRLEAWTRHNNRIPVPFDPGAAGVRGAARASAAGGGAGRVVVELFVPWDVLFPALPHPGAALLANVLFEDPDTGASKLLAWSTRAGQRGRQHAWAALRFRGGPEPGTPMVSVGALHAEPRQPLEWSLLRWQGASPLDATLRVRSRAAPETQHELTLGEAASLLRVHDLPEARVLWRRQRRIEMQLGTASQAWRTHTLHAAPSSACVDSAVLEIAGMSAEEGTFPSPEDATVRLHRIEATLDRVQDWFSLRNRPEGILATRAAVWATLEERIAEIELVRDVLARDTDPDRLRQRMQAQWPRRQANGHPLGQPVLRGQRSDLDGSAQPYATFVPPKLAGPMAPLVVVLHAHGEDALRPFADGELGRELEARGWFGVAPYGRGDTGFTMAGERDVLEVIDRMRGEFPVDAQRLYLCGYEMGGTGTWLLSLRHAELFAAATIVSGYADMDQQGLFQALGYRPEELLYYSTLNPSRLARPGLTTAYRIVHANDDRRISVVHARILADRLQGFDVQNELVVERGGRHGRALFLATLSDNLDAMSRYRRTSAGKIDPDWFGGSGGPVATVFARGPFSVVYGTQPLPKGSPPVGAERRAGRSLTGPEADARTADHFAQEWHALFAGRPRVVTDRDVTPELQAAHNLVVVGDPRTNRLLEAAREQLPVRYEGDRFELEGQSFDFAEAGILYAVASPNQSGKTWVVLSGMAERLGTFQKSLLKLGADYIVTNDQSEILMLGHFRGLGYVSPDLGAGSRKPD